MTNTFDKIYQASIDDPDTFWANAAEQIHWYRKWDKVLDDSDAPFYRWFTGGQTNVCYNAVDRHVEQGHGDQFAIIHDSPITGTQQKITYSDLQRKVAGFAGALADSGVAQGDRVIIYMPMIPEAVVAMLACARI
ncbi:MAG: acetyl-coenzyme A synthetase N-terminal domain-containing protein, partial [bacterium]